MDEKTPKTTPFKDSMDALREDFVWRRIFAEECGVISNNKLSRHREGRAHRAANAFRLFLAVVLPPIYIMMNSEISYQIFNFLLPGWILEKAYAPKTFLHDPTRVRGIEGLYDTSRHLPRWLIKVTYRDNQDYPRARDVQCVTLADEKAPSGYTALSYSYKNAEELFYEAFPHVTVNKIPPQPQSPTDPNTIIEDPLLTAWKQRGAKSEQNEQWYKIAIRQRVARVFLDLYLDTNHKAGTTEYIWLDEFCLYSAENPSLEDRNDELGRMADIFSQAATVCVYCPREECTHAKPDCVWGNRLWTLSEILYTENVLTLTRKKRRDGHPWKYTLVPRTGRDFREEMQREAELDGRWHLNAIMRHANNRYIPFLFVSTSRRYPPMILILFEQRIYDVATGDPRPIGRGYNSQQEKWGNQQVPREGSERMPSSTCTSERSQRQGRMGRSSVASGNQSRVLQSSQPRCCMWARRNQSPRSWMVRTSYRTGGGKRTPRTACYRISRQRGPLFNGPEDYWSATGAPKRRGWRISQPKTSSFPGAWRSSGLWPITEISAQYLKGAIPTIAIFLTVVVTMLAGPLRISPGGIMILAVILIWLGFAISSVLSLIGSTLYVEKTGIIMLREKVLQGQTPEAYLASKDRQLETLEPWGDHQLAPQWIQGGSVVDSEEVTLVDLMSRVKSKFLVRNWEGKEPNALVPIAVHGCGVTCLVLHHHDDPFEPAIKLGIVNMPPYVLVIAKSVGSMVVGAVPKEETAPRPEQSVFDRYLALTKQPDSSQQNRRPRHISESTAVGNSPYSSRVALAQHGVYPSTSSTDQGK